MQRIAISVVQCLFILMAMYIAGYALSYLWLQANADNHFSIKYRNLNSLLVYSHFFGGGLALLCGAIQLLTRRPSHLHRFLGYVYFSSVCLGALGGFYLACNSYLGWITGVGFFLCNILWLSTTIIAVICAHLHNVEAHREWICRSFALTSAAITLRLMVPSFDVLLSSETTYILVSWVSWITNLILIEIYLTRTRSVVLD
jgi:uncharacterized membrane protein